MSRSQLNHHAWSARRSARSSRSSESLLGSRWTFECTATNPIERRWQAWTVLAGGLLFVGMLGGVQLLVTGRAAQVIESHVHKTRLLAELQASEERLRLAQEVAHIGTFEWDIQTHVNTAISKLQTPTELLFTVILRDISERQRLEAERARIFDERGVLLKEIHHRVKNNLQVISSLFALQSRGRASEAFRSLLDESRNRIQSIALVHDQLYRASNLAEIDFDAYLVLEVADDGVGVSPGFDWRATPTLGLQLVQGLAAQLRGSVELDTTRGTRFTVRFANARKPQEEAIA